MVRSMEFLLATPVGLLGVSWSAVVFMVGHDAQGRPIRSDAGRPIPWWAAWPRLPVRRAAPSLVQMWVRNALAAGPDAHPLRVVLEGDGGRAGRWTQTVERPAETPAQPPLQTLRALSRRPCRTIRLTVAGANAAQTIDHLRVELTPIEGGETD